MKRLGPELKMPDLKPPTFFADLYYDLRDRRLLPLVALVVVAIVAVPFLLGSDAEEPLSDGTGITTESGVGGASVDAATLTVVEAKPDLRDYRKRLKRQTPSDPFKQQYTEPAGGAVEDPGGSGSGSSSGAGNFSVEIDEAEGDEIVETVPVPSGGGSGGASPGPVDPDDSGLRFFAFRPDVRFGVAGSGELTLHKELPAGELLPKQNPVVVFVGPSENGSRVFFDVSHEVAMVKGPGRCIGGPQSCSLLALKAGQAADILTGVPGRAFRLKVERIEFVEVERPKPASASAAGPSAGSDLAVVGQFQK